MSPRVFSGCLLAGLATLTAGVSMRFGIPYGLIVCGSGLLVLTFLALLAAGRG